MLRDILTSMDDPFCISAAKSKTLCGNSSPSSLSSPSSFSSQIVNSALPRLLLWKWLPNWITLITWTWCLRNPGWGLPEWRWAWTWSCGNEWKRNWTRAWTWIWTWTILGINVELKWKLKRLSLPEWRWTWNWACYSFATILYGIAWYCLVFYCSFCCF